MGSLKPKKIFIVDDDVMMTEALSDYLTRNVQHTISCFATGEACLKQLHENPEIVILDYYLNTVEKDAANGMEILQAIRNNYPSIKIIMLSSQEQYGIALQTVQKGAVRYVIKGPDAFEEIANTVNTV